MEQASVSLITGPLSPAYLTVEEAAKVLRISRGKAYEMVARREIPSVCFGKCRRVSVAALRAWMADRDAEAAGIAAASAA
jgi:excisionase family DNA binding protein